MTTKALNADELVRKATINSLAEGLANRMIANRIMVRKSIMPRGKLNRYRPTRAFDGAKEKAKIKARGGTL